MYGTTCSVGGSILGVKEIRGECLGKMWGKCVEKTHGMDLVGSRFTPSEAEGVAGKNKTAAILQVRDIAVILPRSRAFSSVG